MLLKALADLTAGDQQHLAGTGKGLPQGGRVLVVDLPDLDAPAGEVRDFGQIPAGGHDLPRGHAAVEEGFNNKAAELSGGAGDNDGHDGPFTGMADIPYQRHRNRNASRKRVRTLK